MDLHPTSKLVASAGMDNVILLWDLSRQVQPNKLLGHKVASSQYRIKFMTLNLVPMALY
jgi:WD40 repeat protein